MVDSVIQISEPFKLFHDIDGQPLEDGYIYIGVSGLDPITNPITVYSDVGLTLPIAQPIRTIGGYPVVAGTPIQIYSALSYYSITVLNKRGTLIYTDLVVEYLSNLPSGTFGSLQEAANADLTGLDSFSTVAFRGGWAGSLESPKGGAEYYKDGTTGTPMTLKADNSGCYDTNGNGYGLVRTQRIDFYMFAAYGDRINDDTTAIQDCIDWADPGAEIWALVGDYLCSGLTINKPIKIQGEGWNAITLDSNPDAYLSGANIRIIDGGNDYLITIEKGAIVNRQNQLYGVFISGVSLDGNNRTLDKGAIKCSNIDACVFDKINIYAFQREWLNCFEEVRECDFNDIQVRWCGNAPTYPSLNLTENGSTDSHNLVRFNNINVGFSLGHDVVIDGAIAANNPVRQITFNSCVWHGILASQDGGRFGVFTAAQKATRRVWVKGGQSIDFISCRSIQAGAGVPHLTLEQEATFSINPDVNWIGGIQEGRYDGTAPSYGSHVINGTLAIDHCAFLNTTTNTIKGEAGTTVILGKNLLYLTGAAANDIDGNDLDRGVWVASGDFRESTANPGAVEVDVGGNRYKGWGLGGAGGGGDDGITANLKPRELAEGTYKARLYWCNLGANAGNVAFQVYVRQVTVGESLDNVGQGLAVTPTALADDLLNFTEFGPYTIDKADFISIRVVRLGSTDSLTNEIAVLGIDFIPN